jgi:peptidoglycan/LPS O-acetylase OafA/YrhL
MSAIGVFDITHRPWALLAISLPIATIATLAISALTYRFVEQPFLRLRHAWRRPVAEPPVAIAASASGPSG